MNSQTPDAIDLDAYFQRIGYSGDQRYRSETLQGGAAGVWDRSPTLKTLEAIHLCHTKSIPFENLSSWLKQPVPLDLKSLQQKLIHQGRGGYCFEHNLVLRSVLTSLGFQIKNLAARVLWNLPEGVIIPRSHMLLQVDIDGEQYIADVGFGGLTLTQPLAFTPDLEQNTPHETFRLITTDSTYTVQAYIGQEWKSLYHFDLQEQQLPDYEVSNWYVSTHPSSLFVTTLIATRPASDCRYALRNNQLTTHYLDGQTERRVLSTGIELRTVLEDTFGLLLPAIAGLDQALQRLAESAD
jgi:N-hydroxyarylamine O-acetyltransferase